MDTNLVYEMTAVQFSKMLNNLLGWLEKAEQRSIAKEVDPVDAILHQRLIIDQYPLIEQIQIACDAAKFACARLTGKEAPKHPDTEKTFGEARARIQSVVAYLKTFKADDFKGAFDKKITQAWMEGKYLTGHDYLMTMSIPNFYFHVTTAYAILRTNGFDVGKTDFIGHLNWKPL